MIDSILSKYLKNFTQRSHGNFSSKHIVQAVNSQELRMRISVTLIALCIFIFSVGCQANSDIPETPSDDVSTSVPPPDQGDTTPMSSSIPTPADAGLQNLIAKAKEDLAQRLSISTNQLSLIEATGVTWPDSSLGCPQEGMVYTQVLTPGYLILLEHDGTTFEYHASHRDTVITCENPSPPVPGTPENT